MDKVDQMFMKIEAKMNDNLKLTKVEYEDVMTHAKSFGYSPNF